MFEEISIKLPEYTLRALTWGSPEKPVILALHGWLDNAASYVELAPLLAKDYYVVALGFPGHGHSDHLPESLDYHFDDAVKMVARVIEQLSQERVIMMGHSLGGAVASVVAATFPEKVSRLIMIDALGAISKESVAVPGRLQIAVSAFNAAEKQTKRSYQDYKDMIHLRSRLNHVSESVITPLVERAIIHTEHGYTWRFDRRLSLIELIHFTEQEVRESLQKIQAPTLLIEAVDGILTDNEFLSERKALIANLTSVQLLGGHHLHLANAPAVAEVISDFLLCNGS